MPAWPVLAATHPPSPFSVRFRDCSEWRDQCNGCTKHPKFILPGQSAVGFGLPSKALTRPPGKTLDRGNETGLAHIASCRILFHTPVIHTIQDPTLVTSHVKFWVASAGATRSSRTRWGRSQARTGGQQAANHPQLGISGFSSHPPNRKVRTSIQR